MKKLIYLFAFTFLLFSNYCARAATYTWTGGVLFNTTSWTNAGNWLRNGSLTLTPPSNTDDIVIQPLDPLILATGVVAYPVIESTESITCKSLTFVAASTLTASTLTMSLKVNGSLTVNGAITQKFKAVDGSTTVLLTGTGTGNISCTSITVGDATVPTGNALNMSTMKCNLPQLTVSGTITVNTVAGSSRTNNAAFTVENDNATTSVTAAGIAITNATPIGTSSASFALINNNTNATPASNINLKLTGASPVSIASSLYGSIDFYSGAATNAGTTTVEYGCVTTTAATQNVATDHTSGLNTAPSIYQNLTFSGDAIKLIDQGTLTLSGNWTSQSGKINATTNSPVITFQGTTQTLSDAGSNSSKGVLFKTVNFNGGGTKTISNTSGTSIFSVSGIGTLTMGASTMLAVASSGKLILISDATGDAAINAIPSTSSITGTVNVQRYFKNGTAANNVRNYRILSSPVNASGATTSATTPNAATSLSYLNGSPGVFTGGTNGPTNGFTVANSNPTIYLYKENTPISNVTFNSGTFKGLTNITGTTLKVYNNAATADTLITLYPGNGYMLYYTGNNVSNLYNKQYRVSGNFADPDSSTTTAPGTLNQGDVLVKLWWNSSTTLSKAKTLYNMVGNPYASTINWDNFSNTTSTASIYGPGLDNTIYVFNYTNKNYGAYQAGTAGGIGTNNATKYIASGQGFFVKAQTTAVSPAPNLTFRETAKTSAQPASLGLPSYLLMGMPVQADAAPQVIRMRLAKDGLNYDESIVVFEADASNAYEDGKDAPRMGGMSNVASLATLDAQKTQQLAINHLHSIDPSTRIKLYVSMTGTASSDTLSFTGIETLDKRFDIYLLDHYKNDSTRLNQNNKYIFNIDPNIAATYGDARLEVVCHPSEAYSYRLLSFTGVPESGGIRLTWKTEHEQSLTTFTLQKADGTATYLPVYNLQSNGSGVYTYLDKAPSSGANKYRLQQNDPFGKLINNDLTVNFDGPTIIPQVLTTYPNPLLSQLNIKLNITDIPNRVSLKIMSLSGQIVISSVQPGDAIHENTTNLRPGVYVVEVSDNQSQRLIGRTKITKL